MEISSENITKTYRGDVQALRGINLTIPHGMFGLLGPNGAGKTTFMRILAGILQPSSGNLHVGNIDATTEQGRLHLKSILGYLPQDLGMYPDLSARDFLDYVGILKGLTDRKARLQRVDTLLEVVALSSVAKRKIKTFSGGMKRRVGIAQALLNDPQLLIVDEPTAGLDPEERIRFRNLLSEFSSNRTVLLSTHIVEDIAQTAQNLAIIRSGQVIFQGTIPQMLKDTRGKVWVVMTNGPKPEGNATIVSMVHTEQGVQYRIIGNVQGLPGVVSAFPAEPTLEDAYIWFMHMNEQSHSPTFS
ncbi:multidrug ABC transporter ATP-binding protein [Dictyobacter alpinus]|uniref:Multidrug ABC transporter ATP-binding protein n=1 Tax=Dictyobacter alpinus TaxID=2014873 RepID=A0A402BB70_9CHLR|nr:ABC transporter ATP-binding protein [Dictyobacter alpinus]GCE28530.1 multidrug ABC transporter ATP-binding protein [Dictyobacter alpinus]